MLAQAIEPSENNTVEQTSEVLSTTADYSTELAIFVGDSNMNINNTVRYVKIIISTCQINYI